MKYLIICLSVIFSFAANADERNHYLLAEDFFNLTKAPDVTRQVDAMLPSMLRGNPALTDRAPQIRANLITLLTSEKYTKGVIDIYVQLYNEKELSGLIELVKSPSFTLLQEKRYDTSRMISQHMLDQVTQMLSDGTFE